MANGRTCSGRGLCALGTCVCVAGVGGVACSEVFTAAAAIAFQSGDAPSAAANVGVEGSNGAVEGSATGLVEYRTRPVQRAAKAPGRSLLFLGHSGAADDGADGAYPVYPSALQLAEAPQPLTAAAAAAATAAGWRQWSADGTGAIRLQSATPAQRAAGLVPARVWPSAYTAGGGSRPAAALAAASTAAASAAAAAPKPELTASAGSAACLGGCSSRGECFHGKCVCDPGWRGDDCSQAVPCEGGCSEHGVCAYGVCFCDPGWTGPACDELVPCPAGCSGHGVCALAKCYCREGWRGADCATPTAATQVEGISLGTATLVLVVLASVGAGLGWGVRHALELRQRRKMREILQAEAQRPFSSGLG